mmetsp:Transcript_83205/g.236055  ORF Transcript_83205/g.236055 Transcript_83205/m.236055 type:complete len:244 (+) Transcript_83205:403-1134(+)
MAPYMPLNSPKPPLQFRMYMLPPVGGIGGRPTSTRRRGGRKTASGSTFTAQEWFLKRPSLKTLLQAFRKTSVLSRWDIAPTPMLRLVGIREVQIGVGRRMSILIVSLKTLYPSQAKMLQRFAAWVWTMAHSSPNVRVTEKQKRVAGVVVVLVVVQVVVVAVVVVVGVVVDVLLVSVDVEVVRVRVLVVDVVVMVVVVEVTVAVAVVAVIVVVVVVAVVVVVDLVVVVDVVVAGASIPDAASAV